jgi:CheY-like chemotaxis protein
LATILIAEDDGDILGILRARLENHGYTVLGARDGAEALEAVRHEKGLIDLVITGIHMPRMNGVQLGEELRMQYSKLPVIYMSAYASEDVTRRVVELQKMGLSDNCVFLRKPFSEEELLRAVRMVLSAK